MECSTHDARWQTDLRGAIRDGRQLLYRLQLEPASVGLSAAAAASFRCLVPEAFARRMRVGDAGDPLLRQVLPIDAELVADARYSHDPLDEQACQTVPGVLSKYRGRVLLTAIGSCAVHCRYCFRRHFAYADDVPASHAGMLRFVAANPDVEEVILSGGDPLMLPDSRLDHLIQSLNRVPHVRRLRLHTRMPVVLPSRVDTGLIAVLESSERPVVVVLHVNHPNEIDAEVRAAVARLRGCAAAMLNQSVLLRGVNDDAATLVRLSEALFEAGILPYYLHALDPVSGAAHFAVDDADARSLYAELTASLPGYLVPKFVREIPGEAAKSPVSRR